MPSRVSQIQMFRVKATGTLITDLSTKTFFIEGDTLVEELIPYKKDHWERGRTWPLNDVEILLPEELATTQKPTLKE